MWHTPSCCLDVPWMLLDFFEKLRCVTKVRQRSVQTRSQLRHPVTGKFASNHGRSDGCLLVGCQSVARERSKERPEMVWNA